MKKSNIPLKERQRIAALKHKLKYGQLYVEKQRKRSRYFYLKNRERIALKHKTNYQTMEYKEKRNKQRKAYMLRWKQAIYSYLGNKCCRCGYSDERAFQIDHVNGDGYLENSKRNATHYKKVAISLQRGEGRYQLLCANCNWIKRIENNENFFHKNLIRIDDN